MLRTFFTKSPLLGRFTWSQCAYYLRTSTYRQLSEIANTELNPVRSEKDTLSQPEQRDNDERLVANTKFANEQSKVPRSRVMDRNPEDLYRRYFMTPDQPENPRLLRVAIIGAPNAGKSTLINTLMGWKVNAVSKKVHTTRTNTNSVFNIDNAQILFVDTPGVITRAEKKRYHCAGNMLSDPERSLHEADAVGVIVDVSNKWTRNQLHIELLKVLYLHRDTPSFLILNKIDSFRNLKSVSRQQKILLAFAKRLSQGNVGGKEFGRTSIEKKKRKKDKKINKPEDMFDELEQNYGKLKVKRKMMTEEKKCDTQAKIDTSEDLKERLNGDSSDDFMARLKDELSGIIKQHSEKADTAEDIDEKMTFHDDVVKGFSERVVVDSDVTESELCKGDSEELLSGSRKQGSMNINAVDNFDEYVNEMNDNLDAHADEVTGVRVYVDDAVQVSGNCDNDFNTENEIDVISEQILYDSDKDLTSDIIFSDFSETETVEQIEGSSDNEKTKTELAESYQSEFLARVQSLPRLQEFSVQSRNDSEQKEQGELSEEMKKLKEAIEAVKDKHGWSGFDRVFPVSALDGTGLDQIKDYLLELSCPADWIYHSSVISDQHPFDIARMCVIQSFLDNMDTYLPYNINPEIIYWDVDDQNRLNISMDIMLANAYEMGLVLRQGGAARIRAISSSARQALMDAFQCEIRFKMAIKKRRPRS